MQQRPTDTSHPIPPRPGRRRALLALAVVHPVPSALNAVLVAVLALIAGGERSAAALLAIAMLGFQFSIGALNDLADVEADRRGKPRKPIPAGLVPLELAVGIVALGAIVGLGISTTFGLVVLTLGAVGYASGVAYDVGMRRLGLGWLCFAVALPVMLAWTWLAAAGTLPPGWPFLLPLAALAGPALHLAKSFVDLETDARADRSSLATQLGARRAKVALAVMMAMILVLAWATLSSSGAYAGIGLVAAIVATGLAVLGVALSWQDEPRLREAGWLLQAAGLATLAAAWLASMT